MAKEKYIVHKAEYNAKRTYCGLPLKRVYDTVINKDVTCKNCKRILRSKNRG